jgi:hypothetical protein
LPKCIDYTSVNGSQSANKKIKFWIQQRSKEATEGTSGLGAPDSVRCTRGIQLQLTTFGNFSGRRAIIHRTVRCSPDNVRCSKEELASLRNSLQPLRYNSPDCPVYTGLSGATTEQRLFRRQRLPAAYLMHALRAQKSGAPILAHRTMNRTCPVCTGHPGGPRSQKLQQSESNGIDDVAGAPDMSGVHRTVRCAIEQTASQRPLLVVGAINTPTTPHSLDPSFSLPNYYKSSSIQF